MRLWKNVLVHVDAREHAREALQKSLLVAEAFGGRVIAFDSVSPAGGALPFDFPARRVDHLLECAVAARRQELRDKLAGLGVRVPVDATVLRGAPGPTLLQYAAHNQADLILKAASPSDVLQMTLSGATTVHLLREAAVPVWLHSPRRGRNNRVVAAVDLSSSHPLRQRVNEQVVLGAARLSLVENAELHVVCVADQARDRLYESILRPAQYRRYLANDRHDLRRSLADLMGRIGPRSVPHLVEGDALGAVEKLVLDLDPEAIVLGRDRSEANVGVLGSYFAERIFCRVDRSLLLVAPQPRYAHDRPTPRRPTATQPMATQRL